MWTRARIKDRAKFALNQNYWKIVLVALIVVLIGGGAGAAISGDLGTTQNLPLEESNPNEYPYSDQYNSSYKSEEYYEGYMDSLMGENLKEWETGDYKDGFNDAYYDMLQIRELFEDIDMKELAVGLIVGLIAFLIIFAIALAIGLLIAAFLLNPVEVGTKRFFLKSLSEKAKVKEVAFAFDNSYKNVVKTLFFRDLYLILWTMLFIIPGIVKGYEYKMIPYLLAENPSLTKEQAFALSKQMMNGQKWRAFVLDLSFLGWDILSLFTIGILSVMYVEPYKNLTMAALYDELSAAYGHPAGKYEEPTNDFVGFNPYVAYYNYTHPQYGAPVQPTNSADNSENDNNGNNDDNINAEQ